MSERESAIEEKEFDLKSFVIRYFRYWYLFAVFLILSLAAAWFYNWYAQPVYQVSGKLLIKDEASTPAKAIMKELDVVGQSKNLENEIEILKSHRLVSQTLNKLGFDVSYFLVGNIKTSEVYLKSPFEVHIDSLEPLAYFTPIFIDIENAQQFSFSYELKGGERYRTTANFEENFQTPLGSLRLEKRVGDEFSAYSFDDPQKQSYKILFHGHDRLVKHFVSRLSVVPISGQSTIVEVSMLDAVPQKAIDFVNTLVQVYLQNDVNQKNRTADNTSIFIKEQLEIISADLNAIEHTRQQYKSDKGIVDLSSESQVVLEVARELDNKIAANNARKTIVDYLQNYVEQKQALSKLAPSTIDINDQLLNSLIDKLVELETENERLNITSTPKNPRFAPLQAEIRLTRSMLIENINNIKNTIELSNAGLEVEKAVIRQKIQSIPNTERELVGIERQYRIQESLYLYLLEKQAEVSISIASSVSENRIVDTARASAGPVKPVKSKAYSIALIFGLLLPVVIIYLIEQLDDYVRDVKTIEQLTGLPILGVVGFNKETSNLIIHEKPNSLIAEAYRSVRTNLKFFELDQNNKVLLITSSVGSEGKTFTAMNLASVLAVSGKKTILLGLDLRKPKITEDFGLTKDRGMSNYLSGDSDLDSVIQPSGLLPDFDIIPSGPVPPNPAELIMSGRMDKLMEELSERYDHIIIDSPPVGLVTDGFILMKYAALSILVVREGVTRKQHLRHMKRMQEQQKLGKLAVLFNAVRSPRALNGGGYGYHYGYGYGYSQYGYYQETDAKKGWRQKVQSLFKRGG